MTLLVPVDVDVIETTLVVDVDIQETTVLVPADVATTIVVKQVNVPAYEGEYIVIPEVVSQTLETKDKRMTDNVLVREIPYYETTNQQNGLTVYIANSLDD